MGGNSIGGNNEMGQIWVKSKWETGLSITKKLHVAVLLHSLRTTISWEGGGEAI